MCKESEEKEVNMQKLIKKWESAIEAAEFYGKGKEEKLVEYMTDFVDDLNQLDEPETLSQEWISENIEYAYFDTYTGGLSSATAIIKPHKLKDLLVPKQDKATREYIEFLSSELERLTNLEHQIMSLTNMTLEEIRDKARAGEILGKQELPVIPQFVADYIDNRKEVNFPIYQAIRMVRENSKYEHSNLRMWLWTNKNQETFARAWLDGYTVEEEPKIYRFEQEAFMEQDFAATSYEEAKKMAEAEWKRMFEDEGLFGEPNFVEELE